MLNSGAGVCYFGDMSTFENFYEYLFPTEYRSAIDGDYTPNPDIPDDIQDILEKVSNDTKIPLAWLEKTAGLVVDGLAGLQCLWFLHGLEGFIETGPASQHPAWVKDVEQFARRSIQEDPPSHLKRLAATLPYANVNWIKGTLTFENIGFWKRGVEPVPHPGPNELDYRSFTVKLGGWLEKWITEHKGSFTKEHVQDLRASMKTRQKQRKGFEWKISAHPYDVLTMSFNRPWKSCMRPDSKYDYQYGILSDLAAGSAMLFFYHPGADVPTGRLILRPALDQYGDPMIASGKSIYPSNLMDHIPPSRLKDMLGGAMVIKEPDICELGKARRALSRLVFSDVSRQGCTQTDAQYDKAYEDMEAADWPEPELDVGDLRLVPEQFAGELSCEIELDEPDEPEEPEEVEIDPEEVADAIATDAGIVYETDFDTLESYFLDPSDLSQIVWSWLQARYDDVVFDYGGVEAEAGQTIIDGEAVSEVEYAIQNRAGSRLFELLQSEPTLIMAFAEEYRDLEGDVTAFVDATQHATYKFVKDNWSKGFVWNNDIPEDASKALGLISRLKDTSKHLYIPFGFDSPDQNELEPYEVKTVIVVHYDEDAVELIKDDAVESEEENLPTILEQALHHVILDAEDFDWLHYIYTLRG